MAETRSGTCECGATVTREVATGFGAEWLNRLSFVCPDCIKRLAREDEIAERQREERERLERFTGRLAKSGLPTGLRAVEFDQLELDGCSGAVETALQWADGDPKGLLLAGRFGVGKTTIAAGALRRMLWRRPGKFLSAPMLMAKLGAGFRSGQHDEALEALTGVGALVLDDLDKARPTDYGSEHIFLAIDAAVSAERPLLVTANMLPDQLAARYPEPYGEAIASRLAGYCEIRQLEGDDRRLRA